MSVNTDAMDRVPRVRADANVAFDGDYYYSSAFQLPDPRILQDYHGFLSSVLDPKVEPQQLVLQGLSLTLTEELSEAVRNDKTLNETLKRIGCVLENANSIVGLGIAKDKAKASVEGPARLTGVGYDETRSVLFVYVDGRNLQKARSEYASKEDGLALAHDKAVMYHVYAVPKRRHLTPAEKILLVASFRNAVFKPYLDKDDIEAAKSTMPSLPYAVSTDDVHAYFDRSFV